MTAIAVGRLNSLNFFVADAMVQIDLKSKTYKECRLQNKITEISSCKQFATLCGEELVANGLEFFNNWHNMNKSTSDLFITDNFKEALICAERYRRLSIDIFKSPIIPQTSTIVYIADKTNIKEYIVKSDPSGFTIEGERFLGLGETFLNFKGNNISIKINGENNVLEQCKAAIIKEQQERIQNNNLGKKPLGYTLEDRFSSVIIPHDGREVVETFPFNNMTDMFLSYTPNWDYILKKSFVYSPTINKA